MAIKVFRQWDEWTGAELAEALAEHGHSWVRIRLSASAAR